MAVLNPKIVVVKKSMAGVSSLKEDIVLMKRVMSTLLENAQKKKGKAVAEQLRTANLCQKLLDKELEKMAGVRAAQKRSKMFSQTHKSVPIPPVSRKDFYRRSSTSFLNTGKYPPLVVSSSNKIVKKGSCYICNGPHYMRDCSMKKQVLPRMDEQEIWADIVKNSPGNSSLMFLDNSDEEKWAIAE